MAQYKDREHYIPLRKSDLVELLCREHDTSPEDADLFRQFARITSALFHFEYHQKLEELKDEYAPFDPDSTTRPLHKITEAERAAQLGKLLESFTCLTERANFTRLGKKTIEEALQSSSDWGLNMTVNFDIFEKLEIYSRGDTIGTRYKRPWYYFGKPRQLEVPIYQRLVVIAKLKDSAKTPESVNTKAVFLKVFKDIPRMDLEMLLPGARMQMPGLQKLKLGGSLLSGLALLAYHLGKYLLTAVVLGFETLYFLAAALFGYAYKQYYGYQTTRAACSLQLTQSLYYQNLDNNSGVLCHLIDEAEEQECRETLLSYYYLWRLAGSDGWSAAALDDFVEEDLQRLTGVKVDFEIDDALAKLQRLGLITCHEDKYCAVPITAALEKIDCAWDNIFKYNAMAASEFS